MSLAWITTGHAFSAEAFSSAVMMALRQACTIEVVIRGGVHFLGVL